MPYSHQVFYGQTINNLTASKVLGNLHGGSFTSGTSAAWLTGVASGSTVTFTSSTANTNVTNLTAIPSAPAIAPSIITSDGTGTEIASVVFKPLAAGQILQMAGLTFTAGSSGATATQLANAFQGIAVGALTTAINTSKNLGNEAGGTFTAGPSAGWTSGATTGSTVTFTSSIANANVPNLSSVLSAGSSSIDITTTDGGVGGPPASTETAAVTFKALAAGQSLTLAGLTFTVGSSGATANQIASAFASIANTTSAADINTAKNLNDAAGGRFSAGTATGWSSAGSTGATVTFTSSTASTNVTNLAGTLAIADSAPTITVTEGSSAASTESATVAFKSMTTGQTLSIAGLTFTAGSLGATSEQVASAYANLAVGTSADNANNILPALASTYVVTPGLLTTTTSLSGYIAKPADGNSYTFLATGSFSGTNANATATIASIKGTISTFKVFINGALAESITYNTPIDTTMFGITDSSGSPPTPSVAAQRAQATLQFNLLTNQINSGSTFICSDASNGGIDQVLGGTGNDRFAGYASNDYFDGRGGVDTAVYRGKVRDYTLSTSSVIDRTDPLQSSTLLATLITDATSNRDGIDTLINVERLEFSDAAIAYDIAKGSNAGDAYRLYKAAFDRIPDPVGLGYWIKTLDDGTNTLVKAAQGFINSPEFIRLNGVDSSNQLFITNLYKFVLQRTPDAAGYQHWDSILANNPGARPYILVDFANSPENIAQVAGLIANGISYTKFV